MLALFTILFFIIWVPLAAMLTGVAFETLWDWFIVPLGVAPIGVAHAMGLSLIINFVIHTPKPAEEDKELGSIILAAVAKHLATIGFVLLIGYIIKSYM